MRNLLLCVASTFLVGNCTNELPLSELINNTITLKFLGTYESNTPYGNLALKIDDALSAGSIAAATSPSLASTSQLSQYASTLDVSRLKYYIDIAEIRLAQGTGKSSSQSISDYWSQLAISRQLMCSDYTTAESKVLTNCQDANGVDRLSQFLNGGFTYPAVDVKSGDWNHLGIYFRRFVTYPAAIFNGDGTYYGGSTTTAENATTAAFDNRTIYGFDVESYLQNRYGENVSQGRMFPLERTDLSIKVVNDHEPYVLEVRVFLKNLMMVHLRQLTGNASSASDATNSAAVYVGLADWKVNHSFVDVNGSTTTGNGSRQGDSLAMTARTYQPSKSGTIQINSGIATTTNPSYYVAMPGGTTFTASTTLPYAATAAAASATITNLPAGTYDVYRTCDVKKCAYTSTGGTCDQTVNSPDGYPETSALCGSVTVSAGTSSAINVAACAIASCS